MNGFGRVVAADDRFRKLLGLAQPSALHTLAESDATFLQLLSGDGPDVARIVGAGGVVEISRSRCDAGTFLRARAVEGPVATALEHAMQSLALSRIAAGVAHDVKNPLNAMALQIALLSDKISAGGEPLAGACTNNLTSLRNQIGRVNDVVRRLADVSDPPQLTAFDVGVIAADVASLFAHEARRRRVTLSCDAAPGSAHVRGDPSRVARLLLGLTWRALARADGGEVTIRALVEAKEGLVRFDHGEADPALAWMVDAAAAAAADMGGRVVHERGPGTERVELRLRREIGG